MFRQGKQHERIEVIRLSMSDIGKACNIKWACGVSQ